MRTLLRVFLIYLLSQAGVALGQENPLTNHNKMVYGVVQKIIVRAAEKMPEENYSFQPTPAVRTFGQLVGHIADSQYFFCSRVTGEKSPAPANEKTKTTKAELIAALNEAFAYCTTKYEGVTDASGAESVKLMGSDSPKLGVFTTNLVHTMEHYGNVVTYLRLKDIVPPTSEPDFMKNVTKK